MTEQEARAKEIIAAFTSDCGGADWLATGRSPHNRLVKLIAQALDAARAEGAKSVRSERRAPLPTPEEVEKKLRYYTITGLEYERDTLRTNAEALTEKVLRYDHEVGTLRAQLAAAEAALELLKDDAYAMTFQTMAGYRTALIVHLRAA